MAALLGLLGSFCAAEGTSQISLDTNETLFAVLNVSLGVLGSLGAALLLNQRFGGTTIFRTIFFLPSITPIIASALLWTWIFQPTIGLMNYLLSFVGIQGPAWLQSTAWAIPWATPCWSRPRA